ncbi:hypothetical protein GUJ93_ZPchr0013g33915 [Zizania palustris]|uniref:Uncharacterized protein n=1 Tax=Zizania palustris TaxID=103762 RepID=A0A8J5WUN8_ZIZPA|nr:hypothetical protein GUJ93_ZPchr0013g33915 [Zizania palustris]
MRVGKWPSRALPRRPATRACARPAAPISIPRAAAPAACCVRRILAGDIPHLEAFLYAPRLVRPCYGGARCRRDAEAGAGIPASFAAAAAWMDLVARRDIRRCRPHAIRPAPQPKGAIPAAPNR